MLLLGGKQTDRYNPHATVWEIRVSTFLLYNKANPLKLSHATNK